MLQSKKERERLRDIGILRAFVMVMLLAVLMLISFYWCHASPAAANPYTPELENQLELGIHHLLRGVPKQDKRIKLAPKTAKLVAEESAYYQRSPHLVLSVMFLESSLKPGIQSKSNLREWGYAQAHGTALRACARELGSRGIELESQRGQVACVAYTLTRKLEICDGVMVRDRMECMETKAKCSGAISAYVSRGCHSARKSKIVAAAVSRRLRLAYDLYKVGSQVPGAE